MFIEKRSVTTVFEHDPFIIVTNTCELFFIFRIFIYYIIVSTNLNRDFRKKKYSIVKSIPLFLATLRIYNDNVIIMLFIYYELVFCKYYDKLPPTNCPRLKMKKVSENRMRLYLRKRL